MYLTNFGHILVELFPGPFRRLVLSQVLVSCGSRVFVNHKVYVRFPRRFHIGNGSSLNRGVEFYPDLSSQTSTTLGSGTYLRPHARFHASGHGP